MLDLVNDFEEFHYDTETSAFLLLDLVRKYDKKLVDMLPPGFVSSPRPPPRLIPLALKTNYWQRYLSYSIIVKVRKDVLSSIQKQQGQFVKIFFLISMKLSQRLCMMHCESYAKTCSVLKIVSWIPSQSGCTNQFCSTPTSVFYSSLTWRS